MEAAQAPQPERISTGSHRVDEEDEPAPKRKKGMSRAARAWRRWVCGGPLKGALQKHIHILFGA